ncbi:copper amine oxidase N-terminal domain-containing protein [Paenibacillus sp. HWE-109]|uniref:copper amine oxidase N-terminal domain-containing protein n=1 Tax=Paenibacillus sp. HWE-109 TaxID=1306526 RepID=UPI001EDCC96D|nr:copper amine oxidase N-terminal domain-containing protein [Paenibacillus sp. HWE-109]UKS25020.1 copper amine oxidase N-terminal domain-containing protein [Paenibacillus sp. HWE-109]
MKKFILGILVGVSITAAGSAYADDIVSIVGQKIDGSFPIKISGKQLDTPAAVIQGTSYLPVRVIGEALNMDVTFNADLGIELKEKGAVKVPENTPQPTVTPTKSSNDIQMEIDDLNRKINISKASLSYAEKDLKEFPTDENQKTIDALKKQISSYEAEITALQNK